MKRCLGMAATKGVEGRARGRSEKRRREELEEGRAEGGEKRASV
uniref:Uncharacterized protein n=1 Tax=Triticum urartu TaxID=4572 RepID=A0A8R7PTN1_TRIUA